MWPHCDRYLHVYRFTLSRLCYDCWLRKVADWHFNRSDDGSLQIFLVCLFISRRPRDYQVNGKKSAKNKGKNLSIARFLRFSKLYVFLADCRRQYTLWLHNLRIFYQKIETVCRYPHQASGNQIWAITFGNVSMFGRLRYFRQILAH